VVNEGGAQAPHERSRRVRGELPASGVRHALAERARRRARSSLPLPIRKALRRVYRALRHPKPPPPRTLILPSDVADADALRAYLTDTDIFSTVEEADAYLADALERFRVTVAMLPELPAGVQVLELGANPYFITRLLRRRGIDAVCANWFGPGRPARGQQIVTSRSTGERHVFDFDHFNVESDRFPYPDGSFQLVLCCEILEHLPQDPIHMLAEIHRVLADGGLLLLTTPNATRIDNLARMLRGDNVYEELSGYGTYGRHNREYTVAELRLLLSECGYTVSDVFALDIHDHAADWKSTMPGPNPGDRGCNLFALAEARGMPRWRYPRWLYSSQHALRRPVMPDLVVGCNDDVQAMGGLYELEVIQGVHARWMGCEPRATLLLSPTFEGAGTIRVEGVAPPVEAGDLTLCAELNGRQVSWHIAADGRPFSRGADVDISVGDQQVVLHTDRQWRPVECGLNPDTRTLSVAISSVALLPR